MQALLFQQPCEIHIRRVTMRTYDWALAWRRDVLHHLRLRGGCAGGSTARTLDDGTARLSRQVRSC